MFVSVRAIVGSLRLRHFDMQHIASCRFNMPHTAVNVTFTAFDLSDLYDNYNYSNYCWYSFVVVVVPFLLLSTLKCELYAC